MSTNQPPTSTLRTSLVSLLAAFSALACSTDSGEPVARSSQGVVNGTEMVSNTFGFVNLTVVDPGGVPSDTFCSGGLFQINGQQAVLTAAHCVEPGGSFKVELLDQQTQTQEITFSQSILVHPAFIGAPPSTSNGRLHGSGMDLAVVFLQQPITAAVPVPDIAGSPASGLLQTNVTIVGAGPSGPSPASSMNTTVAQLDAAEQVGRSTRTVGTVLLAPPGQHPQTGLTQTSEGGDSGGPWIRTVNGLPTLVGTANGGGGTFLSGPHAGRVTAIGASLNDDLVWVQLALEVAGKGGTVVAGNLDNGGLPDQVLVSNRQGTDAIVVVTGEGRRVQVSSPRPTGFQLGEVRGSSVGQFDGAQANTDPRDVVGIANGNLVAISNLLAVPSTKAFSSSTLQPYEWALVKRCNNDQWDDVVAVLPGSDLVPTVDVYYGGPSGLVGPSSDLNARQCVFTPANPVQSSSTQGSCRAGSSVLATTCGARLGDGCWCTADCGDAAHPCCPDVDSVCGSGTGFAPDTALATVVDQEANPWSEGSFNQQPPIFSVELAGAESVRAMAFPLDPEWLLTSTGGEQLASLSFDGVPVADFATLHQPDGNLALIHLAPDSSPGAEDAGLSDAQVSFFEGTSDVLQQTSGSFVAMGETSGGQVLPLALPPTALFVNPGAVPTPGSRRIDPIVAGTTSNEPALQEPDAGTQNLFGTTPVSLAFLQVPEANPTFRLLPGSPIFTPLQELVGVTERTESASLETSETVAGDVTDERSISYQVHRQASLVRTNARPDDLTPSPRYWIQQTITRSRVRDMSGDRHADLLVGQLLPDSGDGPFLAVLGLPIEGTVTNNGSTIGGVESSTDGDWRFVGRAKLGRKATGFVWTKPDSGELHIWRMTGSAVDAVVRGTVPPTWQVSALGDVDGDDIADLIWTNSTTGRGFYWVMEPLDRPDFTRERLESASDPSFLVREFNHFPADRLLDDNGVPQFELVAADHFEVPAADTLTSPVLGPEQAAVDLVWNEIGGVERLIWPMTYLFRACDEIEDPITNERCESIGAGFIRTFELARNERPIRTNVTVPADTRAVGTGDFDDDGRVDVVLHDLGTGGSAGQVSIAFGQADGTFSPALITDANGEPIFESPDFHQVR